jgi:hypothetical protein
MFIVGGVVVFDCVARLIDVWKRQMQCNSTHLLFAGRAEREKERKAMASMAAGACPSRRFHCAGKGSSAC